jgi:hypothetical protein
VIFLHVLFLAGLAGVAVPLLIHLMNRARARPVEWGAMRFLRQSLAVRRRRLMLEEALVLLVRCFIVALLALALARPFIRPASLFPPWMILAAILLPVALVAVGAVFWADPQRRRLFLRGATLLVAFALGVGWYEARRGGLGWTMGAGEKDVVIILDASSSMGLQSSGSSNFERALGEALALADTIPRSDSIGIIWGGPAPRVLIHPTANREAIRKMLEEDPVKPSAGSMGVLEAFYAAAALLEEGRNPEKVVVLITDGHRAGWDFSGERRWSYLSERLAKLPVPPRLLLRRLPMPTDYADAMVAAIDLSRAVIGPDRPVGVDVTVANAGTLPIRPGSVELRVDGEVAGRMEVRREIPVNAVERLRFPHRFETPGRHLLAVRLGADDDRPANNTAVRAVEVVDRLPVLLVDGAPMERFFRGAAGFLRVALTPEADGISGGVTNPPLIRTEVKSVRELAAIPDLSLYSVIVLANVARLPDPVAARLAAYVDQGGGLLVAPGERAEPAFYNGWRTGTGGLVPPALLEARRTAPRDEPFRLDRLSCSHPALQLAVSSMPQDVARFTIPLCWTLQPDPADRDVSVSARLAGGAPFLAERTLGRGRILMTAIALDRRDSNLPTLKSFVPVAHELVYDLASRRVPELHLRPGAELAVRLEPGRPAFGFNPAGISKLGTKKALALEAGGPGSNRLAAAIAGLADGGALLRCSDTVEPGLYEILIPPGLMDAAAPAERSRFSFTVAPDAEEAKSGVLGDEELALVRTRLGLLDMPDRAALAGAVRGQAPGRETWRGFAIAVLLALLAETALTRWVARRRQYAPALATVST